MFVKIAHGNNILTVCSKERIKKFKLFWVGAAGWT